MAAPTVLMKCGVETNLSGALRQLPLGRGAYKKPPLCKGRWQKSVIFDGGVVKKKCNICKM